MLMARMNIIIERTEAITNRINDKIRITPVRVSLKRTGEQLGVIPTEEALEKAREEGLGSR